jgi:hypothetical protein
MGSPGPRRVVAAIPVYDDWESLAILLERLDAVAAAEGWSCSVLAIDDGSADADGARRLVRPYRALESIEVLRLARNLGHQRAIAIGLTFLHQERSGEAVIVMDGDGEDRPEDLPALFTEFDRHGARRVIFAQRARRSEGLLFRAGYLAYRGLHWMLTGVAVRVGNFSVLPFERLATFVVLSEAWNHYAAAVFKARIPYAMVPIGRGTRIGGKSHMSFVSLAAHGLSAISVFGDLVGVRLLLASLGVLGACVLAPIAAWAAARWDGFELPDWAGLWTAAAILLCAQILVAACALTFFILSGRNNLSFLPVRDYRYFVAGVTQLFSKSAARP